MTVHRRSDTDLALFIPILNIIRLISVIIGRWKRDLNTLYESHIQRELEIINLANLSDWSIQYNMTKNPN